MNAHHGAATVPPAEAIYDLVGVGFGPSGIAVAASLDDHAEKSHDEPRPDAVFLERAGSSAWQSNLLFPGADIQHHYLRDFATPRDPRSRFTFSNYLVRTGQFYRFTLMGNYVTRHHWSDYVEWTARQVTVPVTYHREVVEVAPVLAGDQVVAARVTSRDPRDGSNHVHFGRALVVATGYQPRVPDLFAPHLGERVFHAGEFLPRMAALPADVDSFAVVGAGQTAGEILFHLYGSFPQARLHGLTRNSGYRMYELGQFSNEAFFPDETEYFYSLDREQRERELAGVHATNYAAVDPDLSTALYRTAFEDRLTGRNRLHIHKRTEIAGCTLTEKGVRLDLVEVNTGARQSVVVGAVVLGTGFTEPRCPEPLRPFEPYLQTDPTGDLVIGRNYRVAVTDDCAVGIYLNGITERRHGIGTATSFSQMALKAEAIRGDLQQWLGAVPERQTVVWKENRDAHLQV